MEGRGGAPNTHMAHERGPLLTGVHLLLYSAREEFSILLSCPFGEVKRGCKGQAASLDVDHSQHLSLNHITASANRGAKNSSLRHDFRMSRCLWDVGMCVVTC